MAEVCSDNPRDYYRFNEQFDPFDTGAERFHFPIIVRYELYSIVSFDPVNSTPLSRHGIQLELLSFL